MGSTNDVIDHVVICRDGGRVILEDENGRQYALTTDAPEDVYPVGTTLDAETFRMAVPIR